MDLGQPGGVKSDYRVFVLEHNGIDLKSLFKRKVKTDNRSQPN